MACSVIIISDDEDDVARNPVIYISSNSEEETDDDRSTTTTLIDSDNQDDRRPWKKRKKNPMIKREASRSMDDDRVQILYSSDEELPDLIPPSRKTKIQPYAFQEKDTCICSLQNKDIYLYSSFEKKIQDHMHLILRPCDQEKSHVQQNSPETLSGNDVCPRKINCCRRRISEEQQAGSLPLVECDVPYCSDKFEEEDVIQRIIARDSASNHDVYMKGKCRINDERQAASLPFIPIPHRLTPFSSLIVKSEVQEFHTSNPQFYNIAPDLQNLHQSSLKRNFHVKSESVSQEAHETESKDLKPGFIQSDQSSRFLVMHEKSIRSDKIDVCGKELFEQVIACHNNFYSYLERNQLLCLYGFTYLPFNINQPRSQLLFPQSILINTLLDIEYSAGLHMLEDLSSKFIPEGELMENLTDVIFKDKVKIRDLNLVYSTLLTLSQTFPNLVNLSENLIRSALSDQRRKQFDSEKVTSYSLPILFMVQVLEFNLFSLNLCDARKMRHSLCHSLLSMEEGKSNICWILHEIGMCLSHRSKQKKSPDNNRLAMKFRLLSSLQHLIHLGLLTSRDMVNSSQAMAKPLRMIYGNLKQVEDKIIFLGSVEHPLLGLSLILEVMETLSFPIDEDCLCPSLMTVVQYFFYVADSKTCLTRADSEEMVVLLYFCIRCIIECKQESVLQSIRYRLLIRNVERLQISLEEKHVLLQFLDRYLHSLIRKCHSLTPITLQFFCYIKCLIDSLDEL